MDLDLKAWRVARKWTQAQLANALGVSVRSINDYEGGQRAPSYVRKAVEAQELLDKAKALGSILEAIRDDQVSIGMGLGPTQKDRLARRAQLAHFVMLNAEQIDDALADLFAAVDRMEGRAPAKAP